MNFSTCCLRPSEGKSLCVCMRERKREMSPNFGPYIKILISESCHKCFFKIGRYRMWHKVIICKFCSWYLVIWFQHFQQSCVCCAGGENPASNMDQHRDPAGSSHHTPRSVCVFVSVYGHEANECGGSYQMHDSWQPCTMSVLSLFKWSIFLMFCL